MIQSFYSKNFFDKGFDVHEEMVEFKYNCTEVCMTNYIKSIEELYCLWNPIVFKENHKNNKMDRLLALKLKPKRKAKKNLLIKQSNLNLRADNLLRYLLSISFNDECIIHGTFEYKKAWNHLKR